MSTERVGSRVSRRALLGRMAGAAATLVVSQKLGACSAVDPAVDDDGDGSTSCVVTAALTEGPYFLDERLNRSDIRADPASGTISQGVPLDLSFNVSRVASGVCTPLTGAYLDVWHCDSGGIYSAVSGSGAGQKFLRGYQVTDASGLARFATVYPGWYSGRAVHIHFKLRLFTGSTTSYEFTSQFFFDESLTDAVHAVAPYTAKGRRNTLNSTDGIYHSLSASEKVVLTLRTQPNGVGYSGVIDLGVRLA